MTIPLVDVRNGRVYICSIYSNQIPRNTVLPNQSNTILNNNKYSDSTNMNWGMTSRRPIHPNRTNPNNKILRILHSKPNNNKTMRQNNTLKVKKLHIKPNVLKTL